MFPGLPADGSYDAAFWASFWAGLFSGVLYSILTGLLVGLALWRTQVAAERRRLRHEYRRDLEQFRRQLAAATVAPNEIDIGSARTAVPKSVHAVRGAIEATPLGLWRQYLRSDPLLEQAVLVDDLGGNFDTVALQLESGLRQTIRRHNAAQGIAQFQDDDDVKFAIGRILGFSPETILPWMDLPSSGTDRQRMEASFAAIHSDGMLARTILGYQDAQRHLVRTATQLGEVLRASSAAPPALRRPASFASRVRSLFRARWRRRSPNQPA